MKSIIPLIGVGIMVFGFGIVFFLQGNSMIGPTTSFMYSNPKWTVYGEWIAALGIVVIAAGMGLNLRRPRS